MACILIDTNIYLELWSATGSVQLAPQLANLQKQIFVTRQIVSEVMRNKVRIAAAMFETQAMGVSAETVATSLPAFSCSETDLAKYTDDQNKVKLLRQSMAEQQRKHAARTLQEISRSEDPISKQLAPLFAGAVKPNDEQLQKARHRKEVGDPPGKRNDPLGDQLAWEQFLGAVKGQSKIWIVCKDGDYVVKAGKARYLNARLHQDLQTAAGTSVEVFCFDDLTSALAHISKNPPVTAPKVELTLTTKELDAAVAENEAEKRAKEKDILQRLAALAALSSSRGSYLSGSGESALSSGSYLFRHADRSPSIYDDVPVWSVRDLQPGLIDWFVRGGLDGGETVLTTASTPVSSDDGDDGGGGGGDGDGDGTKGPKK